MDSRFPAIARVATDDGAVLATSVTGPEQARPVLLCHGGPGLWDDLLPVAQLLPSHRVYRFDQRGCGLSTGPADYTVARAIADIEALREHWGYDSWPVFGHSWGATLALAYAWTHPDRVAKLVYCAGTGPGQEWKADYRAEEARRLSPGQLSRRSELDARPRDGAEELEYLTLCWCTDYADPDTGLRWAAWDAAQAPGAVNVAANRALWVEASSWTEQQVADWCQRVTMPSLIVHGELDPRPLWNVRRLAGQLPDCSVRVIPDAGHVIWRENEAAFATALTSFLPA